MRWFLAKIIQVQTHRKQALLAILMAAALTCCAAPVQYVPSSVPIGSEKIKILGPAHGKACVRFFLFIPLGISSSLDDAYKDAIEDVDGADGLLEMSVDVKWFEVPIPYILPIYASRCTEVRGKAFKFVGRAPWDN